VSTSKKILILAGELSGDSHAAELVSLWKTKRPNDKFFGLSGEEMIQSGVEPIETHSKTAMVGFVEVLRSIPFMFNLAKRIENWAKKNQPDVLILVDYPGFNLRMAKRLRKIVPTIWYFITPQIWAWGGRRIHKIKSLIDHCFVLFDFEQQIFEKAGIPSTWVGHPLVTNIPRLSHREACEKFNFFEPTPKLIFYPGSRNSEIVRHLNTMRQAAQTLEKSFPEWDIIFSCAPSVNQKMFEDLPFRWVKSPTQFTAPMADFAVSASGTNTLELALYRIPMVVIYKTAPITYLLAKTLVKLPYISLVNIVAGKKIIPELIQQDANPHKIATVVTDFLNQPRNRDIQKEEFKEIYTKLGDGKAIQKTVLKMMELLDGVNLQ